MLALVALLAGCGDLPRPFQGSPGATATRLSQPPPARLAVIPPANALLTRQGAAVFAKAIADQLTDEGVPAVAMATPHDGDWRLVVTAEVESGAVKPTYTVIDPNGRTAGTTFSQPVSAAAWGAGTQGALEKAAADAAPVITAMLTRIEASRRQSDPNSLYNRQARIAVPDVTGAPGDGNTQLARRMREQLTKLDLLVTDASPDFTVKGQVLAVPIAGKMQRIEIQWIVNDASGEERGRLIQLNEIPTGTLDRFWGDVATVVAQEAGAGVKDVVLLQSGRRKADGSMVEGPPAGAKPPGGQPAAAPAGAPPLPSGP